MSNYSIPYHDIDILIPSQKFEVNFSYTSSQMPNFIDSMIMRLLRISPLSVKNIAKFLGMNQRESRIVLDQLITNNEVELQQDGLFHLTNKSMKYFTTVDSIPKVASILEHTHSLIYELTNFNYIAQKPDNNMYGIKLIATSTHAANSENIVRDRFQKQFYQLIEEDIITLKKIEGRPSIYKMGTVKKVKECTVRKSLDLHVDAQAEPQAIKVLDSIMSDELKDKTYQALGQSKKGNNIRDILNNLDGFEQLKLNQYFKDGRFLAPNALFDSINPIESKSSDGNHLFIGPCYSQSNSKIILNKIKESIAKNHQVSSIYWLAPDDVFWGKSLRFNTFINALGQIKTKQNTDLQLKCFLPMHDEQDRTSVNNYRKIIAKDQQKYFYGIKDGILDGNFEIIVVKNEFAVIVLHVLDSEAEYLTSFPFGSISYDKQLVNGLVSLFEAWERPKDDGGISFGQMFKKHSQS
ncbi:MULTISPECIES: hypothetical protein [Acinetobacter]|uniref:hypothetical protein n=1 Tax=Acinetobacter TaxID=469 RepID=UPI0002FBEE08|nr:MULTISPECIES: hypothetical protein [Acinetobacter]EXB69170.1 hypothetical protein J525_1761 [Acinetobacter sp. 21871]EXR62261.1 hypothetical protein J678_2355 [Acinetobacter sp. 1424608]KQE29650.1 hypothetical protein APD42_16230 [Acinetobacter nosocomialis]MBJ8475423.1 hypothetical protein [Acinetobacter bereziniae]MBO3655034.1 hypothetical protein [Acinetobacter bereziniae]